MGIADRQPRRKGTRSALLANSADPKQMKKLLDTAIAPPKKGRKKSSKNYGDVEMLSPVSEVSVFEVSRSGAPISPVPQQRKQGIVIAEEKSCYMVDCGNSIFVTSAEEVEKNGYQMAVDQGNAKFNSPSDWEQLQVLKKQDGESFEENISSVRQSEIYLKNRRTCLLKHNKVNRELRCGRSNMVKLLTENRLEGFLNKSSSEMSLAPDTPSPSPRLETGSGNPTPHSRINGNLENEDTEDIAELLISPVPQQCKQGIVIAEEKSCYMVDCGNSIFVTSAEEVEKNGYQMVVDQDNAKFNSPSDWEQLQVLKKQDGESFEENISSVRQSEIYLKNRRTCLLKHNKVNRELRCGRSNMVKLLTERKLEGFLNKGDTSLGGRVERMTSSSLAQNHQKNFGADRINPVKIPPARGSVVPARQNGSVKYSIIAKNVLPCRKNNSEQVTNGTRCLLQDQDGKHIFMTWYDIKKKYEEGEATFKDDDFGHGLHAKVDRDFLKELSRTNKLSPKDIQVDDAIMYHSSNGKIYYTTIVWRFTDNTKALYLYKRRKSAGYDYQGPIRCGSSSFIEVGGTTSDFSSILEKRQSEMYMKYLEQKEKKGTIKEPVRREKVDVLLLERIHDMLFRICDKLEVPKS
ncbi:hypothetical protein GQ44DRAFT_731150 [Phaeosphaeriaceae sp. PMI808]|nr:hypothetical protein GQ44DRAFT_731150 [Phaeosphaeriaceae sp. PMI808]